MTAREPEGWRTIKLKEVCREITVGYVGPMVNEYVANGDGIPFLRSQNIQPFRLELEGVKFISPQFHAKLKKSALSPGDVAVVRTGYPGTAAVVPQRLSVANCADLVVMRPGEELDSWFLCSLFNSTWGRGAVAGNLVGVAQQHFNVGAAKEMTISLPPLPTQRKIAAVLSAYDDLIENNTRRIQILEEMARALYREWFVEFRFPGHEDVETVETEHGRVPQGWHLKPLKDVCLRINAGGTPSRREETFWSNGSINWFKTKELNDSFLFTSDEKITSDGLRKSSAKLFPSNTILMAIYAAPTVGRLGVLTLPSTFNQAAIGFQIDPNQLNVPYLFFTLYELRDYFNRISQGAAQQNISKEKVDATNIFVPPPSLLTAFETYVNPIWSELKNLYTQIANLRRTRDLLLPKLISGEVDVSDLDIPTGETVG